MPVTSETREKRQQEPCFPTTRYQGSKRKLLGWIAEHVERLEFDTALDAFGGTGSVSYLMKQHGKQVTFNDVLSFNAWIGRALIENTGTRLSDHVVDTLLEVGNLDDHPNWIADTFAGIYYTDEENQWLDQTVHRINQLSEVHEKALAYYGLFQACLVKRPYNLFHRNNLNLRLSEVPRSFGNKKTWDTPFPDHFRKFVRQANDAVFDNGRDNRVLNEDVLDIIGDWDLVYIDTPYISQTGTGVDYHHFYHFLEGLVNYDNWHEHVDLTTKHKRLYRRPSPWTKPGEIVFAFEQLFARFEGSILVVSYRVDGIPSVEELQTLLKRFKHRVEVFEHSTYQYALSRKQSNEVLLIGQ